MLFLKVLLQIHSKFTEEHKDNVDFKKCDFNSGSVINAMQLYWNHIFVFSPVNFLHCRITMQKTVGTYYINKFYQVLHFHCAWLLDIEHCENLLVDGKIGNFVCVFFNRRGPGNDSWVQNRINLGFSEILKPKLPEWIQRAGNLV